MPAGSGVLSPKFTGDFTSAGADTLVGYRFAGGGDVPSRVAEVVEGSEVLFAEGGSIR